MPIAEMHFSTGADRAQVDQIACRQQAPQLWLVSDQLGRDVLADLEQIQFHALGHGHFGEDFSRFFWKDS